MSNYSYGIPYGKPYSAPDANYSQFSWEGEQNPSQSSLYTPRENGDSRDYSQSSLYAPVSKGNGDSKDYTISINEMASSAYSSYPNTGPNSANQSRRASSEYPPQPLSKPESEPEPVPEPKQSGGFMSILAKISDWITDWTPFMLVAGYFFFSTTIYMVCTDKLIECFWFVYMITNFYIAMATVLEAFMSIIPCRQAREAVTKAAEKNWQFPTPDDQLLFLDLIIVAYLPNEKDIIMDRIEYLCNQIVYPKDKICINVVYNTPKSIEPLETEMHQLQYKYQHLRVVKVPNSTSKADNLNHFFTLDTGSDVIAIYDCDHYPHPHGPRWAIERLIKEQDVDIVQGRCVVFNSNETFLTACISVEFDKIYAVSHPGRATMWGFGLFCGSNGYWRTDVLRDLKMDESMLTEDIDSALRAFSKGIKAVHELNTVSYELAPTTFPAFWKQRLRWAQGWAQASTRHLKIMWTDADPDRPKRTFSMRAGVLSLLFIREITYYLVTQYFCMVLSFVITRFPTSGTKLFTFLFFQYPVSLWLFVISFVTLFATLWITNQAKSEFAKPWMIIFFSIIYPAYLVLNATIGLYGHARQITKYSSWNPTERK